MPDKVKERTEAQDNKDYCNYMSEGSEIEPEEPDEPVSPSTMTIGEAQESLGIIRIPYPSGNE